MIKGIRSYFLFLLCVCALVLYFDYKEDFVIALLVTITPSHTKYYKASIVAAFSLPVLTPSIIFLFSLKWL